MPFFIHIIDKEQILLLLHLSRLWNHLWNIERVLRGIIGAVVNLMVSRK